MNFVGYHSATLQIRNLAYSKSLVTVLNLVTQTGFFICFSYQDFFCLNKLNNKTNHLCPHGYYRYDQSLGHRVYHHAVNREQSDMHEIRTPKLLSKHEVAGTWSFFNANRNSAIPIQNQFMIRHYFEGSLPFQTFCVFFFLC